MMECVLGFILLVEPMLLAHAHTILFWKISWAEHVVHVCSPNPQEAKTQELRIQYPA